MENKELIKNAIESLKEFDKLNYEPSKIDDVIADLELTLISDKDRAIRKHNKLYNKLMKYDIQMFTCSCDTTFLNDTNQNIITCPYCDLSNEVYNFETPIEEIKQ